MLQKTSSKSGPDLLSRSKFSGGSSVIFSFYRTKIIYIKQTAYIHKALVMTENTNDATLMANNDGSLAICPVVPRCESCEQRPCWLDQGLYEDMINHEESLREDNEDITNKTVRFELYRLATRFIHGFLGHNNHIKLPACVDSEIKDLPPEPGRSYTSFSTGSSNENEN